MVTKQQQLEWLAKNISKFPDGMHKVFASVYCVGIFVGFLAEEKHEITLQEWQRERDKILKQPTQPAPDNSWYERGDLPPVGVYCCGYVTQEDRWIEIEVIAHRDGHVLGWSGGEKRGFRSNGVKCFRPINTEREKAIEDMSRVMHEHDSVINDDTLGALYDAGYRRVAP